MHTTERAARCVDCGAYCYVSEGQAVHRHCEVQPGGGALVLLDPQVPLYTCDRCQQLTPTTNPWCEDCTETAGREAEAAQDRRDEARLAEYMDSVAYRPYRPLRGNNPLEDH